MPEHTVNSDHPSAREPSAKPKPRLWRLLVLFACAVAIAAGGYFVYRHYERISIRKKALDLAEQGMYAEAEPQLLQVLQWWPKDIQVVRALALAQKPAGKYVTEALPHLTRWCEVDPQNPEAFLTRMDLYLRMEDKEKALADGLRVLELEPNNLKARGGVAILCMETGRFEDAEKHCQKYLSARPDDAFLRWVMASNYHREGKNAKTDETLDVLLKRNPEHLKALILRSIRLCEQERDKEAMPILQKLLSRNLDDEDRKTVLYRLSIALARTEQKSTADKYLAKFKQFDEAIQVEKQAKSAPENLALNVRAAGLLLKMDRYRRARLLLDRVFKQQPYYAPAHRLLEDFYQAHGEPELAARHHQLAHTAP